MTDDARIKAVADAIGFYGIDNIDGMSPRQLVQAFDVLIRAHDAAQAERPGAGPIHTFTNEHGITTKYRWPPDYKHPDDKVGRPMSNEDVVNECAKAAWAARADAEGWAQALAAARVTPAGEVAERDREAAITLLQGVAHARNLGGDAVAYVADMLASARAEERERCRAVIDAARYVAGLNGKLVPMELAQAHSDLAEALAALDQLPAVHDRYRAFIEAAKERDGGVHDDLCASMMKHTTRGCTCGHDDFEKALAALERTDV